MMEGKPNRVALWCVPRTLSSVFCKCMAEVKDSQIFFEYFVAAVHSGPEQTISSPQTGGAVIEPDFTYKFVKEQLEKEIPGKALYFVKDMAYALADKFERLPEGYQHTFLLRHPARVFESHDILLKKIGLPSGKTLLPKGYAYKELFDLHEYVTKELKQKSVVIDADELKANPEGIIRSYCHATGIPFEDSMLSWEPELPNPSGWKAPMTCWMGNTMFGIYKAAFESCKFKAGNPKPIKSETLSAEVKECIEYSMPYYQKLYELRLKP